MSVPILSYHKVGPVAKIGRWLTIEAPTLESHILFFKRRGYRFLQARDLSGGGWPQKAVCLTFDDCYVSTVEYGFPILRDQGVSATFYAVPAFVGKTSSWDPGRDAPLCDWSALVGLQSAGFEVGNHTQNHVRLGRLPGDCQLEEFREAHASLVERGLKPGSVCFPFGSLNESTPEAVRTAGYQVGMSLGNRPAEPTDDMAALPRIVLSRSDYLPKLIYKMWLKPKIQK